MTYSTPGPAAPGPVGPDPAQPGPVHTDPALPPPRPPDGANPPALPPDPVDAQRAQDKQHLDLLSIFHYVLGVMAGLFACFPIFHVVMGLGIASGGFGGQMPPDEAVSMQIFGALFAGFGAAIILLGWVLAALIVINGRFLARREHYRFCLVVSALECFFTPFGTVLGILSLLVLARPTVKTLFEPPATPPTQ